MRKKTNGNSYAYPLSLDDGEDICYNLGLTKRERFALAAMQGLLGSQHDLYEQDPKFVAEIAVEHADQLLSALEKGEK